MARKYTKNPRFEQLTCECGCGETFMAPITTKRPRYKNDAHKKRASRNRQIAQALADAFGTEQVRKFAVFSKFLS